MSQVLVSRQEKEMHFCYTDCMRGRRDCGLLLRPVIYRPCLICLGHLKNILKLPCVQTCSYQLRKFAIFHLFRIPAFQPRQAMRASACDISDRLPFNKHCMHFVWLLEHKLLTQPQLHTRCSWHTQPHVTTSLCPQEVLPGPRVRRSIPPWI